jgi:hypothetical protein
VISNARVRPHRWSLVLVFLTLLVLGALHVPSPLEAQQCDEPECDTTAPTVSVTGGNTQNAVVSVTVTWCDDISVDGTTRSIKLNGTEVSSGFNYAASTPTLDCPDRWISTGNVTLSPGSNTIAATVNDQIGNTGTGSNEYILANGFVAVTPKGATITRPRLATLSDTFSVMNLGSTTAWFKLAATCSGSLSSCTATDSVEVMADSTKRVAVSYQSGTLPAGTGTLRLRARLSTDSTVADSGWMSVSPAKSMIVDASVNQTDMMDMRLCAYACFTNVYTHSTVPYFSGDQPRSITLVNNSLRVFTYPFIHVDLTFLPQSPAVDRIELLVRDSVNPSQPLSLQGGSNNTYGPVYFSRNNSDVSNIPIRIGTMIRQDQYGANNWTLTHGTGIHPMTVTVIAVRNTYSDTTTLTIPLLILREPPGAVARGWYIAGMQRLLPQSGGRMVVAEADGSAFVYKYDSLSRQAISVLKAI